MATIRRRQTPSGIRYDVRFRVNGIQRTRTFRTREDANGFRRKIEGEELAGLVNDPKGGERLFGEFAEIWVRQRLVKGRHLTPSTAQGYRALLRRHLNPAFGATRLRQITPERVREWHAETAEFSRDQAAKGYRLLRAILNTALADGLIGRNPCVIRGAGIEHARERPMLDTKTVLELSEAIEARLRCLVLLGGFTGMRSGELLGLQRRDVDPLHGTVTVERQAHELTGLGRVLTPPKSEAGRRTVALPTFVLRALEHHLEDYVAAPVDSFVFTRPTGLPLRRQDLSHAWTAACAVVGIEGVRPHDLRHHAATVIARNPNVTLRELMTTIGHSSHVAALRYQHATAERSREIATYLDGVITAATALNHPPLAASVRDACGMGVAWSNHARSDGSEKPAPNQGQHCEAAGGIEPPYGALQAPA
jgi:integrase